MARGYDIIVFGATSSVGLEIVRYLSVNSSSSLKWAIAGRSVSSLQPLAAQAAAQSSSNYSPPIIIADIGDEGSLRAMTRQTRVLLTTVGPYTRYGEAVIRACIAEKTNYCDITGEVEWVDEMKKKYQSDAQKAGVYLLSFCGYDSIPSELGVYLAAKELKANGGPGVVESFHALRGGGFPTGTVETIILSANQKFEKLKKRIFGGKEESKSTDNHAWKNNAGIVPESEKSAFRRSIGQGLSFWSHQAKALSPPHFMASVNTPIVHYSAAALGYGGLLYNERLVPLGLKAHQSIKTLYGLIPTIFSLFFLLTLTLSTTLGLLRPFSRFINSRVNKKDALTHVTVIATSKDNKARATVVSSYPGDAGIVYTTLLCVETAKGLAEGKGLTGPTGFSTPTVTMPDELAKRLAAAGVKIDVKKENL